MTEERTYMVFGEDKDGDYDLFATDVLERAQSRYLQMLGTHSGVHANWMIQRRGDEDEIAN